MAKKKLKRKQTNKEIEVRIVDMKNLKLGDYVMFSDGTVGIVKKKDVTFLHDHPYTEIEIFYHTCFNGLQQRTKRYYDHQELRIRKIISSLKKENY